MSRSFKTGIQELDRLLGISDTGMPSNSVMLIRGKAGSGKTTLALQILFKALRSASKGSNAFDGVFMSLEESPEIVIQRFASHFVPCPEGVEVMSLSQLAPTKHFHSGVYAPPNKDELINRSTYPNILMTVGSSNLYDRINSAISAIKGLEEHVRSVSQQNAPVSPQIHDPRHRNLLNQAFANVFQRLFEPLNSGIQKQDLAEPPLIIIIDSLSALANQLAANIPHDGSAREAVASFLRAAQSENTRPSLVILLGEHDSPHNPTTLNESYLCDVEIILSAESLLHNFGASQSATSSASYDYSIKRSSEAPEEIEVAETRTFCRVLKSRNSENQSRRCLYEIRSKKGVVFHEYFPGDGAVLLFQENAPQRKSWDEFLQKEVPRVYPSLRSTRFDAITLQRTFGTLRHLLHHPERTDLFLGTFDSYWLDEFRTRRERLALEQFLLNALELQSAKGIDPEKVALLHGRMRLACQTKVSSKDHTGPLLEALEFKAFFPETNLPKGVRDNFELLLEGFNGGHGLFVPLEPDDLQIFGAHSTEFQDPKALPSFVGLNHDEIPTFLTQRDGHGKLLSIPYNNNVSIMVCRKDLLVPMRDALQSIPNGRSIFVEGILANARRFGTISDEGQISEELADSLWNHFLSTAEPKTWEEILFLCTYSAAKGATAVTNPPANAHQVIIETGVFDTLAATFLELIWACGGHPIVNVDYTIQTGEHQIVDFQEAIVMAARLLSVLATTGIVPENSTIQPHVFAETYPEPISNAEKRPDWLFARHWHSTFVNLLTCPKSKTQPNEFLWQPGSEMELDVIPMPLTMRYLVAKSGENDALEDGFSTRGDWHLAVLRGSENETLAYDLINNLMSLPKMTERAFTCAALPSVNMFYDSYGDLPALNIRKRVEKRLLPRKPFKWFKEVYIRARTRSDISDFRTCMNCIAPIIESALKIAGYGENIDTVKNDATGALARIANLRRNRPALY